MVKRENEIIKDLFNSLPKLNWYQLMQEKNQIDLTPLIKTLPVNEEFYSRFNKLPIKTHRLNRHKSKNEISYGIHQIILNGETFNLPNRPKKLPKELNQKRFNPAVNGDYFMTKSHIIALDPKNMFWGTEQLNGRYMNRIEQIVHQDLLKKQKICYIVALVYLNQNDTPIGVYQIIYNITNKHQSAIEYYYTANAQFGYNLNFSKHRCLLDPKNEAFPIINNQKKSVKLTNKKIKSYITNNNQLSIKGAIL